MTFTIARTALYSGVLLAGSLALSGCMGPTYGTGKSAGEQLLDDLDNIASLGGGNEQRIAYAPRPELTTPENLTVLPPPQAPAADPAAPVQAAYTSNDGPVPASVLAARKEGVSADRRARGSQGDGLSNDNADTTVSPEELRNSGEAFRKRLAEQTQGDATRRRYLSEPPVSYRQPARTAPIGDPGIDESAKAAAASAASGESLGSKIRNILPF